MDPDCIDDFFSNTDSISNFDSYRDFQIQNDAFTSPASGFSYQTFEFNDSLIQAPINLKSSYYMEDQVQANETFTPSITFLQPSYTNNNKTFRIKTVDSVKLNNKINAFLDSLNDFYFSFDINSCLWRGLYSYSSSLLNVELRCNFDGCLLEHVIELVCLRGDNYGSKFSTLYRNLYNALTTENYEPISSSSSSLSFALPLPMSMDDVSSPSQNDILYTLEIVKSNISDVYIEPVYEASRIFSDLIFSNCEISNSSLLSDKVVDSVIEIIESLLSSDNTDVLRIVFFIIEKLSQFVQYQVKFSNSIKIINCLIVSINPLVDVSELYLVSHAKTSAINSLVFLAQNFPYILVKHLEVVGYTSSFWSSFSRHQNNQIHKESINKIISSLSSISSFNK